MRILATLLSTKSTIIKAIRSSNFFTIEFLPNWLPLLLGLVFGPLLAMLIVAGAWPFVAALLFLIPLAILFNTYPFVTILIWLLVTPFFLATPTYGGRYIYWMFHRAMVPVGLGIVILSRLYKVKTYHPVRLGLAELAMVTFFGYVIVSTLLWQSNIYAWFVSTYDRILIPFLVYLLIRFLDLGKDDWKRLLVVVAFLALSQSIIGLLSWFAPQMLPAAWLDFQGVRTTGSLRQPGPYTALLVFAILLLFHAAMNRKPGLLRINLLFIFGLGAILIFLSLSRGSWLGGIFAALGMMFLYPKAMIRTTVILTIALMILGSSILSTQMTQATERLDQQNTIDSRLASNEAMITMLQRKPLFGWGYGNQRLYTRQFISRVSIMDDINISSHHTYLTILVEMGIVGFFLYIFPFGWWFKQTLKAWPKMPKKGLWDRALLGLLWLTIGNHIIVASSLDMRYFPFNLTLWWMTLGLIANIVTRYLNTDDTELLMRQTKLTSFLKGQF